MVASPVARQEHRARVADAPDAQAVGRLRPTGVSTAISSQVGDARQLVNAGAADDADNRFAHSITPPDRTRTYRARRARHKSIRQMETVGARRTYYNRSELRSWTPTMLIRRRRGWDIPERDATPEAVFLDRRALLAGGGLSALAGAAALLAAAQALAETDPTAALYPAASATPAYTLDRPMTPEAVNDRLQ